MKIKLLKNMKKRTIKKDIFRLELELIMTVKTKNKLKTLVDNILNHDGWHILLWVLGA